MEKEEKERRKNRKKIHVHLGLEIIKKAFTLIEIRDPTKPGTIIPLERFNRFDKAWRDSIVIFFSEDVIFPENVINDNFLLLNFLVSATIGVNLRVDGENAIIEAVWGSEYGLGELINTELWFCK